MGLLDNTYDIDQQIEDLVENIEDALKEDFPSFGSNDNSQDTATEVDDELEKQKKNLIDNLNRLIIMKDLLEDILNSRYDEELSVLLREIRNIIIKVVDKVKDKDFSKLDVLNTEIESVLRLSIAFIKKKMGIIEDETDENIVEPSNGGTKTNE